jgi:hypothetical protein
MTTPTMATDLAARFDRIQGRASSRDNRHALIHSVRRGHMRQLFPDELSFSISFDGVPTANFIDIVARDMAEAIAPLPSLACVSGRMKTQADLERAERKNRIGDDYWRHSRLERQMLDAADNYVSYGFIPFFVEADVDAKKPYIHLEDPKDSYYELDRFGRTVMYAKSWRKSVGELCSLFPEFAGIIEKDNENKKCSPDQELKLVRWVEGSHVQLFLPERRGLVLTKYEHKLKGRLPCKIAVRPGTEPHDPRGQFDDVIWVQVARAIMSTLALEAASQAVQAPIAVPDDMDEFPMGPHAILQSKDAKDIHRVPLDINPAVFAENQTLDQEMKLGARYPDARTGGVQGASVITGKGVEALLGTFDTQIKGAQMVLREALEEITSVCFETDEAWWPHENKTVSGTLSGSSYEFSYTPTSDINGRHNCSVTYGFAAGMHPAQSIVTMLQLEGAGLIAKGTTQENLPFAIDSLQEKRKIDIEGTREALKQGLFSVVQSAGPMALQGQDPMPYLKLAVDAIKAVENGKPIEEGVYDAFTTMEQAQQAAAQAAAEQQAQAAAGAGGAPAPGGDPTGGGGESPLGANGLPEGVAPGQAGLPPGGMPTIAQAVAGFRGNANQPINSYTVRRNIPTGT